MKPKKETLQIRNSTAEFLIFTRQAGEDGIEVRVAEETVWLTQKLMAALFDVDVRTVSEHLQNLFGSQELSEMAVCRKFRNTATDGKSYITRFYNLDAIIAVGFRVNSTRATQFRQWATGGRTPARAGTGTGAGTQASRNADANKPIDIVSDVCVLDILGGVVMVPTNMSVTTEDRESGRLKSVKQLRSPGKVVIVSPSGAMEIRTVSEDTQAIDELRSTAGSASSARSSGSGRGDDGPMIRSVRF